MERKIGASQKDSVKRLTALGMMVAITAILGLTPLGIIPIPPVGATIMHIPVIIMAILEGPLMGAILGLVFGIISIIRAITTGNILLVAILNPLVSVVPRILIGVGAYYVYKLIPSKHESVKIGVSAAVGTAINTLGFLGMMFLLYSDKFAKVNNIPKDTVGKVILTIGLTHGIPEIIVAVIITVSVVMAIKKVR